MIIGIVFLIHIIFILFIFVKRRKVDSVSAAFIDMVLIVIFFSVGWSITTMLAKLFWDPIGFGKYFDRDAISLVILTILEFLFYRIYFSDLITTVNEKEKQ